MNSYAEKTTEQQSTASADNSTRSSLQNNRQEAQAMQSLQHSASNSPQVQQLKAYQTMADQATVQRQANNTGMPDNLKSGIESLSGYSMSDVKVHYNSDKPAQLNAHAYAQGNQIHLASGQEKHLPHEAWHVVQQKQGRVKPTMQLKGKVAINDDAGLEHEADVMGAKAMQFKQDSVKSMSHSPLTGNTTVQRAGDGIREVGINDLSEDDAHKHLADSFKKGVKPQPFVDQSGKLVQRAAKKESYLSGDLFTVLKGDLNTGTATSKGTRDYVNDSSTFIPSTVLFDYATSNNSATAKNAIKNNKMAYSLGNPEPDYSYRSGRLWDAGHKLGKQNGGLGNDNDWVFPQNPSLNQGNSKNSDDIEETFPKWREHENDFYNGVSNDGAGAWWIKLQ